MGRRKVIVVGGGASGMMAAIAAAEKGAQVTLLEKNNQLGKKLLHIFRCSAAHGTV